MQGKSDGEPVAALGDEAYQALAEFRQALREFLDFSDASAIEEGLTSQQHQALLAIRGVSGPITVGELAARLAIRNHSALGLVSRLLERGLVSRRTPEDDRRRVLVELKPKGAAVLERVCQRNIDQYARMSGILAEVTRKVRRLKPNAASDGLPPAGTAPG